MRLLQDSIDAIYRQAAAEYPDECCGIVTGSGAVQRVHVLRNIQGRLHAEDPEQHPRDARSAYAVDRAEFEQTIREAHAAGEAVLAFYHSHIDCDAYFSQMDKDVQTVFGEPEFPDAGQVVVSVYDREVRDIRGFGWDRGRQDFVPIPVR